MKKIVIDVIVEIPKNTNVKYEYDRQTKRICVDRILYGSEVYPENYGFIESTLDYDGDELDVLILSDQAFMPGISVPTRIIGAMEMIDSGEIDTKLIGVINCDKRYEQIKKIRDVSPHRLKVIKNFFETYKILQEKQVTIKGFQDVEWAMNAYIECKKMYEK